MASDRSSWDLASLQASEASREHFGWISWRLLGLANVDRRDVVSHSDWVRYTAIGTFMLFFGLYAFGGWLAFLSSAGVRRLGSGGLEIEIVGAVLGAAATLVFDRALVGITKPRLDYEAESHSDASASAGASSSILAMERGEPLPSLVAKPSRRPIAARVLVALIIGLFATQAVDLTLFAGDIDSQRAHEQISALRLELAKLTQAHKEEVEDHNTAVETATQELANAKIRQAQAKQGSGGICREHLYHSQLPSRCKQATVDEISATGELIHLAQNNPASLGSSSGRAFFAQKATIDATAFDLQRHPADSRSTHSGPAADAADLIRFLVANPGSAPLYGAVLILALLLDLAAILLKVAGFDSEYERRQALRRWLAWTSVNLAESRRQADWQRALRGEARAHAVHEAAEREAALTAIELNAAEERARRAALADADQDPEVQRAATQNAAEQVREQVRRHTWGVPNGRRPTRPSPQPNEAQPEEEFTQQEESAQEPSSLRGNFAWTLVRRLEGREGAHAKIYEACQTENRAVRAAIKLMPVSERGRLEGPAFDVASGRARNELKWLQRFPREAWHLPRLFDHSDGNGSGGAWHATAWAPLGTLHDHYSDDHPRRLSEILELARQVLEGLEEADELVHRDLKPANLLLFANEPGAARAGVARLVITDWGLARPSGEPPLISHHEIPTVNYAAPDTLDPSKTAQVADDLFSLGVIMWWCITGHTPGVDQLSSSSYETAEEYARALVRARESLDLQGIQSAVPDDVASFVQGLLDPDRAQRVPLLGNITFFPHSKVLKDTINLIYTLARLVDRLEPADDEPIMVGPTLSSGLGRASNNGPRSPQVPGSSQAPPLTPPTGRRTAQARPQWGDAR